MQFEGFGHPPSSLGGIEIEYTETRTTSVAMDEIRRRLDRARDFPDSPDRFEAFQLADLTQRPMVIRRRAAFGPEGRAWLYEETLPRLLDDRGTSTEGEFTTITGGALDDVVLLSTSPLGASFIAIRRGVPSAQGNGLAQMEPNTRAQLSLFLHSGLGFAGDDYDRLEIDFDTSGWSASFENDGVTLRLAGTMRSSARGTDFLMTSYTTFTPQSGRTPVVSMRLDRHRAVDGVPGLIPHRVRETSAYSGGIDKSYEITRIAAVPTEAIETEVLLLEAPSGAQIRDFRENGAAVERSLTTVWEEYLPLVRPVNIAGAPFESAGPPGASGTVPIASRPSTGPEQDGRWMPWIVSAAAVAAMIVGWRCVRFANRR